MDRKRRRSNAANKSNSSSNVFLPIELITEILSLLSVKAILRFKCVSKSWNILTSDSNLVDKHLMVSSQNPHLTSSWYQRDAEFNYVIHVPVHRLLKNQSDDTILSDDFHPIENDCKLVGSCNGLLCFVFYSMWKSEKPINYWLYFLNPATRTRSEKFKFTFSHCFEFTFGYDALTRTYKVVAIDNRANTEVKVFNLGDNCWRNIQNFPMAVGNTWLDLDHYHRLHWPNNGVHFYGTINWFALDKSITHIEKLVIVSLDLLTETYKQFLLPLGFDDIPFSQLVLRVLMDCLCFAYDSNKTEFILWKMKEYGVQESWTLLFKIDYENLPIQLQMYCQVLDFGHHYQLVCLYVNGDIVIFASKRYIQLFIYNLKDDTVVEIKSRYTIQWFYNSKDYVESLVSVH